MNKAYLLQIRYESKFLATKLGGQPVWFVPTDAQKLSYLSKGFFFFSTDTPNEKWLESCKIFCKRKKVFLGSFKYSISYHCNQEFIELWTLHYANISDHNLMAQCLVNAYYFLRVSESRKRKTKVTFGWLASKVTLILSCLSFLLDSNAFFLPLRRSLQTKVIKCLLSMHRHYRNFMGKKGYLTLFPLSFFVDVLIYFVPSGLKEIKHLFCCRPFMDKPTKQGFMCFF